MKTVSCVILAIIANAFARWQHVHASRLRTFNE